MSVAFACDISAIPPADRPRHHELTQYLVTEAADEIEEVRNGLFLTFRPADLAAVTEFLARESLCCPFVDFTLRVPSQGPVRLELSGPDGVTEFLRAELGIDRAARQPNADL